MAIVRTGGDGLTHIPALERVVSFGAAIQNILLGAQALGFGAGLTSGRAMQSASLRTLCDLAPDEHGASTSAPPWGHACRARIAGCLGRS